MYELIQWTVEDGVATLKLNNPDKLNSFNQKMHHEIQQVFHEIETNLSIRVLVITGVGRAFSAGQDLSAPEVQFLDNGDAPDFSAVVKEFYKPLILQLRALRVPSIAAVNGVAAGAGASLALACDLVIAVKSASFIQAFSQIGLIPDTGGTWFLPRLVGLPRAMGLALLGDKLSADQALEWGLIWDVSESDDFVDKTNALAKKLATLPTKALVETRKLMEKGMNESLSWQLDEEAKAMGMLGASKDFKEGATAFKEKRAPRFTGE